MNTESANRFMASSLGLNVRPLAEGRPGADGEADTRRKEAAPLTTEGPPVNDAEVAGPLEGGQLPLGGAENEKVRGATTLNGECALGMSRPIAGPQVVFLKTGLRAGRPDFPCDGQIGDTWRGLGEVVAALVDGRAKRKAPRPRVRFL